MPPPPPNRPGWTALAEYLGRERHGIVTEWAEMVRQDPQIPDADRLTLAALQDHFPEMLQELISGFGQPSAGDDAEARETGHKHGRARWRNGYRLNEVLRELARVREALLARVRKFCQENNLSGLRDEAEEKIRHFFDQIVATSARQFMQEQEAEVLLRSQQLQHAYEQVHAATEQLHEVAQSRLNLLRGVSHELRNALQSVEFGATALLGETDRRYRESIETGLTGSATRLQQLLDRLLEFSNILAGETRVQVESMDVGELVGVLERTHRPRAESKGLEFHRIEDERVKIIRMDAEKVRHIGDILLANAVQYTDRGSVRLSILSDGPDRWILRVEDTGAGMDENGARHIFREFHRVRGSGNSGVGLGLVIARHLAHLLDGEITFRTKPGVGTSFEVNLPIEPPTTETRPTLPS